MNLLHDITPGTKDEMHVVVECPKGSKNKYEIDKETGMIALDRALPTAQDFPFEYGFVPQTLWDDGDALDVVILSTFPFVPGVLVKTRAIGIMRMVDTGESDDKIIGVPTTDVRFADVHDIKDVNPHTLKEVQNFFETYKLTPGRVVVNEFEGKAAAEAAFERAVVLYKEKH